MAEAPDSSAALAARLDPAVIKMVFVKGTVAYEVEVDLNDTIRYHNTTTDNRYLTLVIQKTSLSTMESMMSAWQPLLAAHSETMAKSDLIQAADSVLGKVAETEKAVEHKVAGCFTSPIHATADADVSVEMVHEICQAASKVYLTLAETISEQEKGLKAKDKLEKYFDPPRYPVERSDQGETSGRSVSVLQPGDKDYDPVFPQFTKDTPGVVAEMDDELSADEMGSSGEKTAIGADGSMITPGRNVGGNFKHGTPTPWLPDEEDFVLTLLIVYRDEITWKDVAEATNVEFANKPITLPKTGMIVQRGERTFDGVRQHPSFGSSKQWLPHLDAQTDLNAKVMDIDWAQEYRSLLAMESAQSDTSHDPNDDLDELLRRTEAGWLANDEDEEAAEEEVSMDDA